MFAVIKQLMEGAIARKRQIDEGRDKAVKDVAGLNSEARWDLYVVGQMYARNQQFAEAQRLFRACLQVGNRPPVEVLLALCQTDFQAGDWASLRSDLSALERADAAKAHSFRVSWAAAMPAGPEPTTAIFLPVLTTGGCGSDICGQVKVGNTAELVFDGTNFSLDNSGDVLPQPIFVLFNGGKATVRNATLSQAGAKANYHGLVIVTDQSQFTVQDSVMSGTWRYLSAVSTNGGTPT